MTDRSGRPLLMMGSAVIEVDEGVPLHVVQCQESFTPR